MKKIAFISFMAFVAWKLLLGQSQVVILEPGIKAEYEPVQLAIKQKDYFQYDICPKKIGSTQNASGARS